MYTKLSCIRNALVGYTVFTASIMGCAPLGDIQLEGAGAAQVTVYAPNASASIDIVSVTINGEGITPPIAVNLRPTAPRTWTRTVSDIPAGTGRTLSATAYNDSGGEVGHGIASYVAVFDGETTVVTIFVTADTLPPTGENKVPEISSVYAIPSHINAGESAYLNLSAQDPENGPVSYHWQTDCDGAFNNPTTEDPVFTLRTVTDDRCTLTVTVYDAHGAEKTASISVDTGEPVLPPPPGCSGPIAFPDPVLESYIRDALGIPTGGIHFEDVAPLSRLEIADYHISDLTGLNCFVGLTYLDISKMGRQHSPIDISPITDLTNLTELVAENIHAADISPIGNLTGLTRLTLSANDMTDISPLGALTGLTYLDISWCWRLRDISPLSHLTNLVYLDVASAEGLSDISPISALTKLETLYLWANDIGDSMPLAGLTSLTYLDISYNQRLMEVEAVRDLENIDTLIADDINLMELSAIANSPGIGSGDLVELRWNWLDCDDPAIIADAKALMDRGVTLIWECD